MHAHIFGSLRKVSFRYPNPNKLVRLLVHLLVRRRVSPWCAGKSVALVRLLVCLSGFFHWCARLVRPLVGLVLSRLSLCPSPCLSVCLSLSGESILVRL